MLKIITPVLLVIFTSQILTAQIINTFENDLLGWQAATSGET